MSDLLDGVRAVNPVTTCEQPSIEDVWRTLKRDDMRAGEFDCPGGPDEDRPARVPAGRDRVRRHRVRRPAPARRGFVVSVVAAIVVATVVLIDAGHQAGGLRVASPHRAASAAVRRLAAGTISCDFAAVGASDGPAIGSVPTRGRSAIAFCRDRYRAGADASRVTFIVCQTSATNVAVYLADGHPDQCHRLGDRVLPAGYAAAVRQAGTRGGTVSVTHRATAVAV